MDDHIDLETLMKQAVPAFSDYGFPIMADLLEAGRVGNTVLDIFVMADAIMGTLGGDDGQ